ncbi:heme ABC transporter ATP-binding protein [Oceanisphaera avium]|uniref:Heme ABC transporter ATP-binding protein n=1 Tax=Oceanisphaera avium TaxID=1903694 RepID=A0A1Y0CW68_9GAMM|nr:heme ABC transporter ATP-binding protein [Oceanisphaera avium]ART79458.1 heme ABC transporter ATP-binding protein [Oceanisphaera avium]
MSSALFDISKALGAWRRTKSTTTRVPWPSYSIKKTAPHRDALTSPLLNQPVLAINNLSLRLSHRQLLKNINVELKAGQVSVLIGANGAGKSSLFKCIAGEHSYQGKLHLFGQERHAWCRQALARQLGVLPQQSSLQFPFLAKEVVSLGRIPHQASPSEHAKVIEYCMRQAQVWQLRDAPYPQLSGGEKQRIHFARVLAQLTGTQQPKLLLLDEPTSALDLGQQHSVLEEARRLASQGCGVLVIIHDLNLAARYGDQLLLLDKGELVSQGSAQQVLSTENVARYFGYKAQLIQSPFGHPILI